MGLIRFLKQEALTFVYFYIFFLAPVFAEQAVDPQIYNPDQVSPSAPAAISVNSVSPALKKTVVLPLNEDEKPPERKWYQVKRGDTLWRISKNSGVTVAAIKRWNQLKSDQIKIGQRLMIEENPMAIRLAIPLEKEGLHSESKAPDLTPPSQAANPSQGVEKPKELAEVKNVPAPVAAPVAVPLSLKERFLVEVRKMVADRVHYNESWRPEGASNNWVMDCSNTTRFLFHKIFKIDIGRTASEQYYRLKVKGQAWEVPMDAKGRPDIDYLHENLKEGDLLFWEHTYSPDREPPITHVTVYLGTDEEGRFLMVGSEQGKGLLDSSFNGPDLYYFNPLALKGGHHQFLFFGWKPGKFVAHGRPLAGMR